MISDTTEADTTDRKGIDVVCPAGKKVLGGGFVFAGPIDTIGVLGIEANRPQGDNGWVAVASEHLPGGGVWSLGVYAVCANVED